MHRSHYAVAARALDAIHRIVNVLLIASIVFFLALFGADFVRARWFTDLWPVAQLHRFGDPILARIAGWFHAQGAKRYVSLVLAAISYGLIFVGDQLFPVLNRMLWSRAPMPKVEEAIVDATSEEAREELYRKYREIEKVLKDAKRKRCTFLSVDVVGSTQMKTDESDIAITATFRAYEEMLKRTFLAHRAWKQSWTPDGVMICFLDRENAIASGKAILENLATFNQRDNQLKTPFQVRCGANEGEVVVFEDSNLEKLVDHVIDVAGHMQKHANVDTLWLSAELYGTLEDQSGFRPTGNDVDGYKTYEWSPKPVERAEAAPSLGS